MAAVTTNHCATVFVEKYKLGFKNNVY